MTGDERLTGLVVVVPALLVAIAYAVVIGRRGAKWPWAVPIGVTLIGGGLLIPWLPLSFAGVAAVGVDVYQRHGEIGRPRGQRRTARHRARR